MMMGSVACAADGGDKEEEEKDAPAPTAAHGDGGCPEGAGPAAAAGADDPEEEGMPVQLHTFSDTMFADARPIRLYQPSRLGQGADLRVEDFGHPEKVGDGIAGMSLSMLLGGTRVTDFGALEDGGVLPTLIGGPAAAAAAGAAGAGVAGSSGGGGGDDGHDAHAAGGTTKLTLALYTGGRLELGLDFDSCTVVALPGRIMSILDVVLACLMGPPAAREAQELNALEDEVEMEEAEEATGGAEASTIVDSRWKAMDNIRGAYLFLGRLDARFSVRVRDFSLLLPHDSRDTRTNVIMAQVRRWGGGWGRVRTRRWHWGLRPFCRFVRRVYCMYDVLHLYTVAAYDCVSRAQIYTYFFGWLRVGLVWSLVSFLDSDSVCWCEGQHALLNMPSTTSLGILTQNFSPRMTIVRRLIASCGSSWLLKSAVCLDLIRYSGSLIVHAMTHRCCCSVCTNETPFLLFFSHPWQGRFFLFLPFYATAPLLCLPTPLVSFFPF